MPAFKYHQRWYRRSQILNKSLLTQVEGWLFDTSSLTARLMNHCGSSFNVKLLSQAYVLITADELAAKPMGSDSMPVS